MSTQILSETRDALDARRVYGEPYEKNGLTVIPAASVRGAGGAGGGESPEGKGDGGGFGLSARPTGAWIIEGGVVRWKAAVDVTRVVLIGELAALAGILAWRSVAIARAGARRRRVALAALALLRRRPSLPSLPPVLRRSRPRARLRVLGR